MKRILKFIGCLALGCVGLTTLATTTQVADQAALNTAVAAAQAGDVIEITTAGTYTFPSLPNNITLKGVKDVVFDCKGSGSIASVPNGAKLEGISFVFGTGNYHGWQGAGKMEFSDCAFEGLFFSYGDMIFNGCTFKSPGTEYCMWCYAGDITYKDCTVNCEGKFANVYNEHNGSWKIVAEGCTFNSTKVNKSALNVKSTCGTGLKFDVTVNDCTVNENFPAASTSASLIVFNGVVQLDDIKADAPNEITITVDGRVAYKDNAPIPEPITVTVEKNEEKGVTQDVVTEIAGNKEVGKLEETGLKEALPAEELAKGEPVIKVQLQEVAANTLKFDVSPYVGTEKVDSNTLNGKPVAVRLPLVAAQFNGEYAKIIHGTDPIQFVLVKKGTTGAYVDLTLTHFSEVEAILANAEEIVKAVDASAVEIQPGLWGANGKSSLNDAAFVYIVGATGLKAFRDWVNGGNSGEGKTFQLVADVDLAGEDWTPIADKENGKFFKGVFDGCGHSVLNMHIPTTMYGSEYIAFISALGDSSGSPTSAAVMNLTVTGDATGKNVSGIVARNDGGLVSNVVNRVVVTCDVSSGKTGGFTVLSQFGSRYVDCVNDAPVQHLTAASQEKQAAGFVAYLYWPATFIRCTNKGPITGKGDAGGFAGTAYASAEHYLDWEIKFVNCTNTAAILSTAYHAGGLVAQSKEVSINNKWYGRMILDDCANLATVTTQGASGAYSGAFVGAGKGADAHVETCATALVGQKFHGENIKDAEFIVAKITNDPVVRFYPSVVGAIAAAKAGDTVTLVANSTEAFTLPLEVTFDASAVVTYDASKISAPEGYFVKEVSTKVYECRPAVAQIGTKIFSSIPEAFTAAVSGDTILIYAGTHDSTTTDSINGLIDKKVTIKGEGQDKTILNWGSGFKRGNWIDFGQAQFTFEDLALNIDHTIKSSGDGTPGSVQEHCIRHPLGGVTTYRNVTINGLISSQDDVVFDHCTFTGPNENSKDEYLVWQYNRKLTIKNCLFKGTGSHAPVKIYAEPKEQPDNYNASLEISDTVFEAVGDEKGAIVSSCNNTTFAYDLTVDFDTITVPAGASCIGSEKESQWGSKNVSVINGTKDANGKYLSGICIASKATDAEFKAILAKIMAYGCELRDYTGSYLIGEALRGEIVKLPDVAEAYDKNGQKVGAYPYLQDAFAAAPSVGKPVDGYTIKLLSDVDLAGTEWTPVSFCGTFDGNGKKISNMKTGTLEMGTAGFFSGFRGNAKDVTFVNAEVVSKNYSGVFTAQVHNSGGGSDDNLVMTLENIKIENSKVTGIQKCGGLIGFLTVSNGRLVVRGCTVDGLTFDGADPDGIWQAGGIVGYLQTQYAEDADFIGNTVKDITFVKDGNVEYFKTKYQHLYFSSPFIGSIDNRSDRDRRHGKSGYGTVTLTGNKVEGTNTGYQIGPKSNEFIGDFYTTDEVGGSMGEGSIIDILKIDLDGEDITLYVAQLAGAEKPCKTVAEAMADAKAGDTVNLIYMCDENVALKPDVSFKLNGKEYTGNVTSADDGYMAVYDETTGTWTAKMKIVEVVPAGETEGTKYTTLAEAFGAVQDGGTVKLLAVCGDGSAVSVGGEKTFVFDLGGFACTAEFEFAGGTAVISNGTVKGETPVTVKSAGSVILVDSAKVVGNAAAVCVRGGGLEVTGGMVQSQTASAVLLGKGVAVAIAGGTFIGGKDQPAIAYDSTGVGEGEYPANFIEPEMDGETETGKPLCSSRIPAEYIAVGYVEKDNKNGTWTVTKGANGSAEVQTKDISGEPDVKPQEGSLDPTPAETTEAKEQAAEIKENIVKAMTDPEVSEATGTGIKQTIRDGDGNLKQTIVDLANDALEAKGLPRSIDKTSQNVDSHVEIQLESVEVSAKVEMDTQEQRVVKTELNKVIYDIKPILTIVTTVGDVKTVTKREIPTNTPLDPAISFRLWLDESFKYDVASVVHKHGETEDPAVTRVVKTEKGRKYIELTWSTFSEAIITGSSSSEYACQFGDTPYTLVADALAAAAGDDNAVIYLLKDCVETGLSLKANQKIVKNGHAVTHSVGVPAGQEMVTTKDGEIYAAEPKIDVPVGSEGNGVPIRGFNFTGTSAEGGDEDAKRTYLAAPSESGSGNLRWQDYVLFGNNPATTPKLIPQIVKAATGFSTVQIKAQDGYADAVNTPAKCGVEVKFQLMRSDASATRGFVLVGDPKDEPVFQVDVKTIGLKTYWKIQTIFETTEDLPTQAH